MNPDAGGIILPEYDTGAIVLPAMDGIIGPVTRNAINDLQLSAAIKTMQVLATAAPVVADSFYSMSDVLKKLGKQVADLDKKLKEELPPTTEEVRLGKANLARTVSDRG